MLERLRRIRLIAAAGVLALGAGSWVAGQEAESDRPRALVADIDGIIHPVAAEFFNELIAEADTSGADVVVVVLRTPGGLLESTRAIVSRMITSRAPVVVFIAPAGARAASAGFILALAADVTAMAPGTHIGAAHPVSGGGEPMDETTSTKAASDTAAYARSLAEARNRNVMLSEEAVLKSRAFTDREALAAVPPLIDVVAADVEELLRMLDGRMIRRFDGREHRLHTANAVVERREMTWRQRFLSAIAHPQVAYLLMTLGILGLTVELWNPGAIFPGVAGGLSLLLAFFAFQIVPIDVTGLVLIVFGLGLLILELKVPSFGVLGIGGIVALVIGSVMATSAVPGVRIHFGTVVPAALLLAAAVLGLGRLALNAQRRPAQTGIDAMIGEIGRTRAALTADVPGQIDAHGEIWHAISRVPLPKGVAVRIVGVDGLTLRVEPTVRSASEGEHGWKT
ncbi:MAG: NfeD family protein [Vicinamibacterales bacterium]